jgi:CHAD domain-containing protein
MKNNPFNQYVLRRSKSIELNLSAYIKDKNPECLHRLRVDIKKIRAIFSFADKVYKEKYSSSALDPLFKKTGKIREIQINIHLLTLFPFQPKRLINQLKKKENRLTQQLINNASQYVRLIMKFREKKYLPDILPDNDIIIKYFKKEKQKSNKKLDKKDRDSVHQFRTRIKYMMYVFKALPKIIQKEIVLNKTKINIQQKIMGEWHDTYSAVYYLNHQHLPKKSVEYILKLKEIEKKQFNALFNP